MFEMLPFWELYQCNFENATKTIIGVSVSYLHQATKPSLQANNASPLQPPSPTFTSMNPPNYQYTFAVIIHAKGEAKYVANARKSSPQIKTILPQRP